MEISEAVVPVNRAGRDGKHSDCVLYYSAKDVPRMIRMIEGDKNADLFVTMVKYAQQVWQVVVQGVRDAIQCLCFFSDRSYLVLSSQFGDDQACRALILRNMGEPNQKLDECQGLNDMVEKRDVSSHAVTVLQVLRRYESENVTMPMLIKYWRQNAKQAPEL